MKIAIVTGASSGMGREFVMQLPAYVCVDEIWAIARRAQALETLKAESTVPVRPICLDLCCEDSFSALAALLEREKPDVRLLVNAAGFGIFGRHDRIPMADECRMIDLNCKALLAVTRIVLPYMQEGGHILQLDSLSAFQPVPYLTTYAATKAFVLSYCRGMNRELRDMGVRMMAMNPGWVRTEFFNHAFQSDPNGDVQYFNRLFEARDVVATGLKDLYRTKKEYSVHGLSVRMQVRLVKLLPHDLVMNIWVRQQRKPKNNTGLTKEARK